MLLTERPTAIGGESVAEARLEQKDPSVKVSDHLHKRPVLGRSRAGDDLEDVQDLIICNSHTSSVTDEIGPKRGGRATTRRYVAANPARARAAIEALAEQDEQLPQPPSTLRAIS